MKKADVQDVGIKGMDRELWRKLKAECALHDQLVCERMYVILTRWFKDTKKET